MNDEARWLSLDLVLAFEPVAEALGVSEVARSRRGFLPQYVRAEGVPSLLSDYWRNRRNNFVARHYAQVLTRHEPLVVKGLPSRRLLALIMWAAAPGMSPRELERLLKNFYSA